MKIINSTSTFLSLENKDISIAFQLIHLKDIWLFNCSEGCQHYLLKKKIKINQISKIIITDLNIKNISGLLGLLSSLSLTNRKKELDIYGPRGLNFYLELGKKYSKTTYRYNIYFHRLNTGLLIDDNIYQVYTFFKNFQFSFIIITVSKYGKFKLDKAKKFYLKVGPLYGKLKRGLNFLLPDGFIFNGNSFTYHSDLGKKTSLLLSQYHDRQSFEIISRPQVLL